MTEMNDSEFRELLKKGVPPANTKLERDMWPTMLRRMEKDEKPVPWFDWVLLGAIAASLVFLPQMIPMLLYHL
jgi:hypothetical protein